mgnify:CR=1 FL=1
MEQIRPFGMPAFHRIDWRDVPQRFWRDMWNVQMHIAFERLLQTRPAIEVMRGQHLQLLSIGRIVKRSVMGSDALGTQDELIEGLVERIQRVRKKRNLVAQFSRHIAIRGDRRSDEEVMGRENAQ